MSLSLKSALISTHGMFFCMNGIIACALAACGRAENMKSMDWSIVGSMFMFMLCRCGNTSDSFLPAALRPVTCVMLASGCWCRMRASSAPAYPVTFMIPTRVLDMFQVPRVLLWIWFVCWVLVIDFTMCAVFCVA